MNKIFNIGLLAAFSVISNNVNAFPQFVTPAGASGCGSCHTSSFGGDGLKSGVYEAYVRHGIQGLYDYLHPDHTPVLSAIDSQWDVTVGEIPLTIPLSVSDQESDSFDIKPTITPTATGITLSTLYTDNKTHLPTKDLKWSPTTAQGNKNYSLSVYALETSVGHSLQSNTVTANIHVWPARVSTTKNVQQFILQSAQWSDNKLTLAGLVVFKPTVTATQRNTYLNTLTMSLRSNAGIIITGSPVKLTPTSTGNWTKTFTLSASQVPCLIKVTYEGLNAARTVKSAPAASCLK